jgi:predicted metal-dependent peptidase
MSSPDTKHDTTTQASKAYVPTEEEKTALSKAKIHLMAKPDSVFFTTLLFSLRCVFDPKVNTACTNGRWIRINPSYFMNLSVDLRVSLLIHETMHCAYMHMARMCEFKMPHWNYATDYVINWQLRERGFKIGDGWLLEPKYADKSSEEIYKLLRQSELPLPTNPLDSDFEEPEDTDESFSKDMEDILITAQIQSRMANDKPGTIPGEIEIFLNTLLNPLLPWQRILQKYLNKFSKTDYSWKKPNRRFFPRHHLPSLWGQSLMDFAVAADTSGSVSDHEFLVIISEIAGILKMMQPDKISFIQFDTCLKSVDLVENLQDLMAVKFTGRGGTEVGPIMQWAAENKPQAMMVFTDGYFNWGNVPKPPVTDIIWLIHNNPGFTAPFGKVIHYKV